VTGPLDGSGQGSLVLGAIARNAARDYFTPLVDKSSQDTVIVVRNVIHVIFAEATNSASFSLKIGHFYSS
jgi:hypothetical protein